MTAKEFYGTDWKTMDQARNQVLQAIRAGQRRPRRPGAVLYTTSRIKSPESACRKLRQRGLPATAQAALTRIRDAVGVRVICAFQDDVYRVKKAVEKQAHGTRKTGTEKTVCCYLCLLIFLQAVRKAKPVLLFSRTGSFSDSRPHHPGIYGIWHTRQSVQPRFLSGIFRHLGMNQFAVRIGKQRCAAILAKLHRKTLDGRFLI